MTTNTATWGADRTQNKGGIFSSLLATLKRYRSRRRTNLLLADLDDAILYDIGLDPSQVRRNHYGLADWVVQTHSGTARLVFIGR